MRLITLILAAAALMSMGFPTCKDKQAKKGQVAIHLTFKPENKFPGQMQVHELPSDSKLKPWVTGSEKDASKLPLGEPLDDSTFHMTPGGIRRFVLTMKNPTKKTWWFFASPHQVEPAAVALGFEFRCLCLNHAYNVPPGHTWYRVIEVKLDPNYKADEIEVVHALIGVDKKRAKDMQMPGAVVDPPAVAAKGAGGVKTSPSAPPVQKDAH